SFGRRQKLRLHLQTESSECGLACVAMICSYYTGESNMQVLRRNGYVSAKGATLGNIISIFSAYGYGSRPVRADLDDIASLTLPCILHWNLDHFVVLSRVSAKNVTIFDPSGGIRKISIAELSRSFTGIALEVWPVDMQNIVSEGDMSLRLFRALGNISGIWGSGVRIFILAFALELFGILSPFYLQLVIDKVVVSADKDLMTLLALAFGTLVIFQQTTKALRAWLILFLANSIGIQWQANVFSHLIRLPVQYFERRQIGDVTSRFSSINAIQSTLSTSFVESVIDGIMAIAVLIVMFIYSVSLTSLTIITIVLYCAARYLWYRPMSRATEEHAANSARQQTHFLETVRGIKSIKLFSRFDERRSSWFGFLISEVNSSIRMQKILLYYKTFNGFLFGLVNVVIIWLGAKIVMDGYFTIGAFIAFNAYRLQFESRVTAFIDKFFEIKLLRVHADRLADIVSTPTEENETASVDLRSGELVPSVEVTHLSYKYSEFEPLVIDNVSFQISAGECVAVSGPSGCGKSTMVNLLLGLLKPTSGSVTVGGRGVSNLDSASFRAIIGTVLQDDVLFAGTIEDNIAFFDPNPDLEWIRACAETAAIAAEIEAMPMRYMSLVGDMGTILSGGQKQRILLARALYKRPKILILDEATSHLDVSNEKKVSQNISKLKITRIIVAHRPETIASADRVLWMVDGRLVQ
ncbi:peptidase domain-containing ABC transporter, partial [Massilia sp. DJPM01]|uniref:peptidase domain-containing ABC transporter n=1 Tax=Massilia sp. DJPM01 TaxID=3024404 RepID=UPI00259F595B